MPDFTHPAKWRDTVDPFTLSMHHFALQDVLGYPHAGNDVFQVCGTWQGQTVEAYIKAARHPDAQILREVQVLTALDDPRFPRVIDHGESGVPFSVTLALPGKRLSVLKNEDPGLSTLPYMTAWGQMLARIHTLRPLIDDAPHRRFMDAPDAAMLQGLNLDHLIGFFDHAPGEGARVFCHGDCHYANILWQGDRLSAVLDFELCGMGDRDYDIAWALIRRPGQAFMDTEDEIRHFLHGYQSIAPLHEARVRFFMAQIYVFFLAAISNNTAYAEFVRTWLNQYAPMPN